MTAEQEIRLDLKHENVEFITSYALDHFWNKPQDAQNYFTTWL